MIIWKRFLINWMGIHGRRHERSRHVSLYRLTMMGIGSD